MTVNNPVNFSAYNCPENLDNNLDKDCPICLSSLEEGEVVAHDNGGHKHPIHKDCLVLSMKVNNLCPICRVPINGDPLFSWEDRMIIELNQIKLDAKKGALIGLIVGIFSVIFYNCLTFVKNEIEETEYFGFGVFARQILDNSTETKAAVAMLGSITASLVGIKSNQSIYVIMASAILTGAGMSVTTGILERRIHRVNLNAN